MIQRAGFDLRQQRQNANLFVLLDDHAISELSERLEGPETALWEHLEAFVIKSLLLGKSPTTIKGTRDTLRFLIRHTGIVSIEEMNRPGVLDEQLFRLQFERGFAQDEFFGDDAMRTKGEWLGAVERIVHSEVLTVANFVSPFAINRAQGQGYDYWLVHFSKSHRAREVYNDVLHLNAGGQAHFGKSGLKMLDYRSNDDGIGTLDWSGDIREKNVAALHNDLPEVVFEFGDAIPIELLKASVYNETAAHSDEFKKGLIENQDIEVLTQTGSKRRSATAIKDTDVVRVTAQRHLFPTFYR